MRSRGTTIIMGRGAIEITITSMRRGDTRKGTKNSRTRSGRSVWGGLIRYGLPLPGTMEG